MMYVLLGVLGSFIDPSWALQVAEIWNDKLHVGIEICEQMFAQNKMVLFSNYSLYLWSIHHKV